jgi:hypothetical protein
MATSYSPLFGQDQPYLFNPTGVASDIGQYYETALGAQPGYQAIQRNIAGVLSPEAKRVMGQAAAERGVGIGSYGGGNDATALLRALGLQSQELTNKGLEQYQQAYGNVPKLNPNELFVNPTSQAELNQRWMTQQASDEAAMARLVASEKAATERAKLGQSTALTTTGWNLGAQAREFEANRADSLANTAKSQELYNARTNAQAQNNSIGNSLSNLANRLQSSNYGTATSDQTAAWEAANEQEFWDDVYYGGIEI